MGPAVGSGLASNKKMNPIERAYRKKEWEQREKNKRLGLDTTPPSSPRAKKRDTRDDDDDDDNSQVPNDYSMPVATLVPGRLLVGPPCVTRRQHAYLRERLGNPRVVPLELPPQSDRRLWKLKEAVAWYSNYAKALVNKWFSAAAESKDSAVYLCHETGNNEEALVGLIVWSLLTGTKVPALGSQAAFLEWRERTGYLWFLDREEESLLPIALAVAMGNNDGTKGKKSSKGLAAWLKQSK
jgi:hypothetical protein